MPVVSKEAKNFEYYPDLPKEVQMMLINEMPLYDRCRFTRCSKLSKKQVETSKHFRYTLKVYGFSERCMQIKVGYTDNEDFINQDEGYGYLLDFKKEPRVKKLYIRYLRLGGNNEEIRRTEFDSRNLVKYALEYFKNMVKINRGRVQKLIIGEPNSTRTTFQSLGHGIEGLTNLEELEININFQIPQIISKLKRPLRVFEYYGKQEIRELTRYEQIQQVRDKLIVPELKLNKDQFLNLSASQIHIHIGDLKVADIHEFIQSWQNGQLRANFRSCQWNLKESRFESSSLFVSCGGETRNLGEASSILFAFQHFKTVLGIKQNGEPTRFARLTFDSPYFIRFSANFQ